MTRQLTSKFLEVRGGAVCGCVLALVLSWWGFAGVARAATLTAPTISGAPQEGVTLAAIPGTPGPVGDTFDAPTYQWLVCSTPTSCTNGPTTATFLLSASEVGKTIEVAETVNDTSATPPAPVTTTSTPTTAVLPAVPTPAAGLPSVLGAAVQNGTLSVVHGGWNGSPTTYTDTWYRCAVTCAATGIVGSTYVLGLADIGSTIEVVETATNLGGASTASETSAQTAAAVVGIPVNTVPPAITGTPQQGQVLTLTPGTWSNAPTLADVWEDCTAPTLCSAIPGATGLTYTVGAGDVGHTIAVQETASNLAAPGGIKAPLIHNGDRIGDERDVGGRLLAEQSEHQRGRDAGGDRQLELGQRQSARLAVLLQRLQCDLGLRQQGRQRWPDDHDRVPGLVRRGAGAGFGCIPRRSHNARRRLDEHHDVGGHR